jgi:hypothetical protein
MTPSNQDKSQSPEDSRLRFSDTERDEATLGRSGRRPSAYREAGLAGEDQPPWSPPESKPEPRPAEPILIPPTLPKRSPQTKSPA